MSIKTTIKKPNKKSNKYPCLLIGPHEQIVLFSSFGKGCVMDAGKHLDQATGDYRTDWLMDAFSPFHGAITLEGQ